MRKITVNLPSSLVERAMAHNELNLSETIREALKLYNHRRACQKLLELKGKVKFDMTWQELRDKENDRDLGEFLTEAPAAHEKHRN